MAQKNMFRRILSPRNKDVERERERQNQSRRSYSASTSNGHEPANAADEVMRIDNTAYGEPDAVSGQVPSRSLSTPGDRDNPPLPPRNVRPSSMGHHGFPAPQRGEDESPVYVAPADTLVRKPAVNPNVHPPPAETQTQGAADVGAVPTKTEKKKMQMHQLTMSQKRDHQESRTRSVGHVIDTSDYSTPFDLKQQMERRKGGKGGMGHSVSVPGLPPPKPSRVRQQVTGTVEDDELIIPVMSPPPVILSDRDMSNSPSSPLSTPSSEQDIPEYPPDDGTNDYDEPWDRKFKNLHFSRPMKRPDNEDPDREHHHHQRLSRDSPPHPPHSHHHHPPHHHQTHENVQLRGSTKERPSSPAFELRGKSVSAKELGTGGGAGSVGRIKRISPQPPEVPPDLSRPQLPRRTWGRDGSTSPIQGGGGSIASRVQQMQQFQSRSYSQSQPYRRGVEPCNELAQDMNQRAGSVSMSNRRLPSPPEAPPPLPLSQPPPPTGGERRISRNTSPPTSMIIDTTIPLADQPWYHGSIKRTEAESILIDQPDFSFLVRNSESCKTDFSLSIRDLSSGFIHLRIVYEGDSSPGQPGYVLGQFSSHFQTVPECIAFYLKQRLNIRGTEHKRLRYPVPRSMNHMASFRI